MFAGTERPGTRREVPISVVFLGVVSVFMENFGESSSLLHIGLK